MHGTGCRRWFNVLRDTGEYEVLAAYRLDEPRPALPGRADVHQPAEPAGGRPMTDQRFRLRTGAASTAAPCCGSPSTAGR
ncbi:hypothetical protein SANTM175S_00671 [Streptomyces antimycoticus]